MKLFPLSSDRVSLAVTETGGHLSNVTFTLPSGGHVSPMHVAPWADEIFPDDTPAILRVPRGAPARRRLAEMVQALGPHHGDVDAVLPHLALEHAELVPPVPRPLGARMRKRCVVAGRRVKQVQLELQRVPTRGPQTMGTGCGLGSKAVDRPQLHDARRALSALSIARGA